MKTYIKKFAVKHMTATGRLLHNSVEKSLSESGTIPWQLSGAIEEWLSHPTHVNAANTKRARRGFGNYADNYILNRDLVDAGRNKITAIIMQQVSNNWQPPMGDVVEGPKVSGFLFPAAPSKPVQITTQTQVLTPVPEPEPEPVQDPVQMQGQEPVFLRDPFANADLEYGVKNESMRQLLRDIRADRYHELTKKVNK